jgi:hypothetical protein
VRKFVQDFQKKSAKSLLTQICAEKNMRIKQKKCTTEENEALIDKTNFENSSSESKSVSFLY